MNVLSFDSSKVTLNFKENIVIKKTTDSEYATFLDVQDYLNKVPIILDQGIRLLTAPLIGWSPGILITEYCNGLNLEHALKSQENVNFWIKILGELLNIMEKKGLFWGDFAPRNMVYDPKTRVINIFDFERSTNILDSTVKPKVFARFFCNYAYEELSCLISQKLQKKVFNPYLKEDTKNDLILSSEISSRRKIILLNDLFGPKGEYHIKDISLIEKAMSLVATPYVIAGKMYYPMYNIEKIVEKGGINEYKNIISRILNSK